ncbi:MAG: hypothetical protein R2682_08660 [Pyrinomonadaceae bacterium]
MKRGFAGVIAIVGWLAIALEFYLTLAQPRVEGVDAGERVIRFFSYFTILTNIVVAITTSAIAFYPTSRLGKFFSRAGSSNRSCCLYHDRWRCLQSFAA